MNCRIARKVFFLSFAFSIASLKSTAQHHDATRNLINSLEQKVVAAIIAGDTFQLKQLWAPEFLVNNPRNDISINRDAVLQTQRAGLINYTSFQRVVEQMQFQKDVVITMGYEYFVSATDIPGARAGEQVKRRFSNVWMKKNGNWRQIARHASIICK